ncbi:non-ribosomal peptide synthetase [Microbacterium sp. JB110]|nr:non-ribosomal peptide synthetase [Microbacterium sp. JB110]SJM69476.1 Siderophore biosynthesis non-ribosomal peptide synthetase modules [Frigoribacterium sp. JB110]
MDAATELFGPLTAGATVVVASDQDVRDPERLAGLMSRHEVTHLLTVPGLADAIAGLPNAGQLLQSVRSWVASGEVLGSSTLGAMHRAAPDAVIHNFYGSTEVTGDATAAVADHDAETAVVPIGGPAANTFVRVLDSWLRPVPPGTMGELYVGGAQLAQGYAGQSALSAARFVADPTGEHGERLYRTGDVVRWNDGGRLEFLGRSDDQVKIRGFRIEPDEIRNILETHELVSGAIVVALDHPAGGKFLTTYVTLADTGAAEDVSSFARALRAHAGAVLPEYMVPTTVTVLDRFPVTANGKLDRRALPAPDLAGSAGAGRAPETETERTLAAVFRDVLRLDDGVSLSVDDDFFRLGGHSLLATRVVARANAQLGAGLTLRDVFDHPTIAGLARVADDAAGDAGPVLRVGDVPRPDKVPASFGQQALWVTEELAGSSIYRIPVELEARQRIDPVALAQAIGQLVARHETLRTTFSFDENTSLLQQTVHEASLKNREAIKIEQIDRDRLMTRISELVRAPMDLSREFGMRFHVLRHEHGDVLVLPSHHLITDEQSFEPLIRDLNAFYAEALTGRPAGLPSLPLQYADFAVWHRAMLGDRSDPGSLYRTELDHWRDVLTGLPAETVLPLDYSRDETDTRTVFPASAALSSSETESIDELLIERSATPLQALMTALSLALWVEGAGSSVPIGTPISLRDQPELSDLIGYFVNTVVVRADIDETEGFGELLHNLRGRVLDAEEHKFAPFESVVETVSPQRVPGVSPLFQVMAAYLDTPEFTQDETSLFTPLVPPESEGNVSSRPALFDLVFSVARREKGRLSLYLNATRELFSPATTSRLLRGTELFLTLGARYPSLPIRHLAQLVRAGRAGEPAAEVGGKARRTFRLPLADFDAEDAPLWRAAVEHSGFVLSRVGDMRLRVLEDGGGELEGKVENPATLDAVAATLTGLVDAYRSDTAVVIERAPGNVHAYSDGELTAALHDPFWEEWADEIADAPDTTLPRRGEVEATCGGAVRSVQSNQTGSEEEARTVVLNAVTHALDSTIDGGLVVELCEPDGIFMVRQFPVLLRGDGGEAQGIAANEGISQASSGLLGERAVQYEALIDHPQLARFVDDLPIPKVRVTVFATNAEPDTVTVKALERAEIDLDVLVLSGARPGSDDRVVRVEVAAAAGIDLDACRLAEEILNEIAHSGIALAEPAKPVVPLRVRRADRLTLLREEEEGIRARYGHDAEILPLSPLQHGLFYHLVRARESGDHNAYVSLSTRQLSGRVDAERMARAAATAFSRYPNLSAAFIPSGEAQVIPAASDVPFRVIRLPEWEALGTPVSEFLANERRQPFDFETPPLIRFTLLEHAPEAWTLAMSFEHILIDGWSLSALLEEIFDLYADPDYADRMPPASFRSYLDWLDEQDPDIASRAWDDYLAGLTGPTLLWPESSDLSGTQVETGELHRDLDPTAAAAVFAAARTAGVTVGTLLQTAWGIALSRLTGSDDVVFGNTVSGRPAELSESDRIIGLLFNTVPMRIGVTPVETVEQLLSRVQARQLTVIEYPQTSLTKIQAAVGMSTLFDTLFVVQNHPFGAAGERDWAGVKVVEAEIDDATHYPVTFAVNPWIQGDVADVHVRLSYRRDAFDDAAAERLLERYLLVLRGLTDKLDVPVGELTALLPDEAQPHTGIVADLHRAIEGVTVASLLERQVRRSPNETALVAGSRRFVFAEFSAEVNRYARLLLEHGVRPEHRVALLLPRDERMVIAMFAVFAVGAAYVPVDAELPDERIGYMFDVASPTVTLVTDRDAARLGSSAGEAVNLDDEAVRARISALDAGSITVEERGGEVSLDHLAYIIFTSGSTGRPKGVAVAYRGLTNMYANHVEKIFDRVVVHQAGRRMRIAHTTSFSFDASWEQLFWLLNGHAVYVIDEEMRRDPQRLLAYYDDQRIDGFDVTPSYGQVLVDEGLLERDRTAGRSVSADAPGVVFVSLGGEAVPERLWQQLRDAPGVESYNLYGPTEYTINALGADLADSTTPSVGTPIFNTRAYILDDNLQPTLPGVAGELYLAGAGNARGYWGQSALTAERFVACPWEPGERMYRTGDLARWNAEGHIDYLGRADEQVKIRGYRIEPDEIRAVLETHPLVAGAAVIAADHPSSGTFLAAYVIPTDIEIDDAALRDAVRTHAAQQLPDYMVPASYMRVEAFPLTPNGKLDRRALPEPELGQAASAGRKPETETERTLMKAVQEVLRLGADTACSVDDDFFRLGGDSILSIQLMSMARRAGIMIAASEVFSARTVAALARIVDERASRETASCVESAEVRSSRLWPIARSMAGSPGFASFAQAALYTVPADTSDELVTRVLAQAVQHHGALNARLTRAEDGNRHFELLPLRPGTLRERITVQQVDSAWSDPEWTDSIQNRVTSMAHTMDPERGVLWRAALFTSVAEDTSRLLLVVHHLVVDGVSWRILEDDLQHSWEIETGRTTDPLLPAGTSMTAWAEALATRAVAMDVVGQTEYWANSLTVPDPLLGARHVDPKLDKRETARRARVRVPSSVAGPLLSTIPSALSAEVNDVLLSSLAIAVGAWRAQRGVRHRRVLVGLEGHGREEQFVPGSDLSRTVGWFTTWYPVGVDTADADPVAALDDPKVALDAVVYVRDQLRQVPDKGIGYGVLRSLNPDAASAFEDGHMPQIGFNYLGQFGGGRHEEETAWAFAPEAPGLSGASDKSMPLPSVLDINISAVPDTKDGGWALRGSITYASGILAESDVQELSDLWVQAMTQLSAASETLHADRTDTHVDHGEPRRSKSSLLTCGGVDSSASTPAADAATPDVWVEAIRVPLLQATNGRYLFAIHPLEGFAFVYSALRDYLPANLGIMGLQDPAHAGVDANLNSRTHVAAVYADVVQQTQPSGPYHLLGWSLGAHIAFTVGQELERRGERVASLTIIDTPVKVSENTSRVDESRGGHAPVHEDHEGQAVIIDRSRERWLSLLGLDSDDGAEGVLKAMAISTLRSSRVMSTGTSGSLATPALLIATTELLESASRVGTGAYLSWDSHVLACTTISVPDEDHYSILNSGAGLPKWGPQLKRFLEESIRSENKEPR